MKDRNEIKISFNEPKYYIDAVNRVVVCVLEANLKLPVYLEEMLFCNPSTQVKRKWNKLIMHPITSKGIAKTSFEDIFDEKTGMKVALAKAETSIYTKVAKALNHSVVDILKRIDTSREFISKAAEVIAHNNNYIKQF